MNSAGLRQRLLGVEVGASASVFSAGASTCLRRWSAAAACLQELSSEMNFLQFGVELLLVPCRQLKELGWSFADRSNRAP